MNERGSRFTGGERNNPIFCLILFPAVEGIDSIQAVHIDRQGVPIHNFHEANPHIIGLSRPANDEDFCKNHCRQHQRGAGHRQPYSPPVPAPHLFQIVHLPGGLFGVLTRRFRFLRPHGGPLGRTGGAGRQMGLHRHVGLLRGQPFHIGGQQVLHNGAG